MFMYVKGIDLYIFLRLDCGLFCLCGIFVFAFYYIHLHKQSNTKVTHDYCN